MAFNDEEIEAETLGETTNANLQQLEQIVREMRDAW